MDQLIVEILDRFETALRDINAERTADGGLALEKAELTLLGQMSLLCFPEETAPLPLTATLDVDGILKGDWVIRGIFKSVLSPMALQFDDLSDEIWMPPETVYSELHHSELLLVRAARPLYVLTSKAVKAPDKNRFLIKEALELYGAPLKKLIEKYSSA